MNDLLSINKRMPPRNLPDSNKNIEEKPAVTASFPPPLAFILALHQGNDERVTPLINSTAIAEPLRSAFKGKQAAWRGDRESAYQLLNSAIERTRGIDNGWAHYFIAEFHAEQSSFDCANKHISCARHYAQQDTEDKLLFKFIIDLLDARVEMLRGSAANAVSILTALLRDCSNIYLKAIAYYLSSSFACSIDGLTPDQCKEYLYIAINVFQEVDDKYYLALARIEMALLNPDSEALSLSNEAIEYLHGVGRINESQLARERLNELVELKAEPSPNIDQHKARAEEVAGFFFMPGPMKDNIFSILRAIARSDKPVLILGPSGVGKSALAEAIHGHKNNPRGKGPFVRVNCANVSDDMFENAFFGHESGAYTGASRASEGYFAAAEGGTLFLDECGQLSPAGQAKLLTVLDSGEYYPLGKTRRPVKADVRIIAATNRDLVAEIANRKEGESISFRPDLFYRLTYWRPIYVPSLAERRRDILPLAGKFLLKHGKEFLAKNSQSISGRIGNIEFLLADSAKKFLLAADYPGNIRELEQYISRGIELAFDQFEINAERELAEVEYLPEKKILITAELLLKGSQGHAGAVRVAGMDRANDLLLNGEISTTGTSLSMPRITGPVNFVQVYEDFQREFLHRFLSEALTINNGNRKATARFLDMKVRTLHRYLDWCGLKGHLLS